MNAQVMSFYIPRMRTFWTQDQVAAVLHHPVGLVDRLDYGDYAPANQTDTCYAFVHLSEIPEGNRQWIDQEINLKGHCKIQVSYDEFWMLIPNRNPIPTTHMNIHQLADVVSKQAEKIAALEELVYNLYSRLETKNVNSYERLPPLNFHNISPAQTREPSFSEEEDYSDMPALISISDFEDVPALDFNSESEDN